jgi:predicted nucleotidyltransferase
MIRDNPIRHDVRDLIPKVEVYLKSRKDVHFAYLFGSLAGGSFGPLSDVDIAVHLAGASFAEMQLEIIGDLTDILRTDEIDLVVLNTAPLTLRMKILQNKRILVDNAPLERHFYESLTLRSYFDFSKIETRILEKRYLDG